MAKYRALSVTTRYWKPNDNYIEETIAALRKKIEAGDFVVVSEKALSIAIGNIVDETRVKPSFTAKLLASFWMHVIWGYWLGIACHFGQRLLKRLREYPLTAGSKHKQVALEHAGFLNALMFGSEGGIDGSNLAYSYVSLPLLNADKLANKIREQILLRLNTDVYVIIADTDKTYKFGNFFFTPRPHSLKGIHSFGGVVTYAAGRILRLKKSSTPLAVSGCTMDISEAIKITNIADRARRPGSGGTVWDMAARFQVNTSSVSWEMLDTVRHNPLVIVRKAHQKSVINVGD